MCLRHKAAAWKRSKRKQKDQLAQAFARLETVAGSGVLDQVIVVGEWATPDWLVVEHEEKEERSRMMPGFFTEASGEVSCTEVLKMGKEMDLRRKFKDFVLDALSSKCPLDSSMSQLGRWDIRRVFESLCYGKQTSKETKKNL